MNRNGKLTKDRRIFEIMLIVVTVGLTYMLFRMGAHKLVVLNLFYLPIVLSGYFLGRGSAGVLALFSAAAATIAVTLGSTGLASFDTPVMMGLALTVWAATLGLTAILVGTLSDERAATVNELHEAYVGVVDVLATYLRTANPERQARSTRIAELSQAVAGRMKLPRKQIDDIRVAALLHDMQNVEITIKLIHKALGTLEADSARPSPRTFLGADLANSLGSVVHGAVPLLLTQDEALFETASTERSPSEKETSVATGIIRALRAFDQLTADEPGHTALTADEAMKTLRSDPSNTHDPDVLAALQTVVAEFERRDPTSRQRPGELAPAYTTMS